MSSKKVSTPPRPLANPVVCEPPNTSKKAGRPKFHTIWEKVMQLVREQNGRTVKICAHPKARNATRQLYKAFPDIGFVTREIPADRGTTIGVWAWLKAGAHAPPSDPSPEPPGVPPPPVDPVLTHPSF